MMETGDECKEEERAALMPQITARQQCNKYIKLKKMIMCTNGSVEVLVAHFYTIKHKLCI